MYVRLLAVHVSIVLEKKPSRHSGAEHPWPVLAWPGSPSTLTPTDLVLVSLKKGKLLWMFSFISSLSCKNSALKNILHT